MFKGISLSLEGMSSKTLPDLQAGLLRLLKILITTKEGQGRTRRGEGEGKKKTKYNDVLGWKMP